MHSYIFTAANIKGIILKLELNDTRLKWQTLPILFFNNSAFGLTFCHELRCCFYLQAVSFH